MNYTSLGVLNHQARLTFGGRGRSKATGKLPPYGREFVWALVSGQYLNPWLHAGRGAWAQASRRGPGRPVLPEGADPASFDWRLVDGLEVVVRWPGASIRDVDELGVLLVRAGANTVLVLADVREDSNRMVVLRRQRRFILGRAA